MVKRTIKKLIAATGFDLIVRNKNPKYTLLGLREYPFRTILDIGANIGQSAKRFRREFPKAKIYCFEPLPDAYAKLQAWSDGQDDVVRTFNVALGAKTGSVEMYRHVDHIASSSLLETTATSVALYPQTENQETVTIPLATLDEITDGLDLEADILIKLDVQGVELDVISGGRELLAAAKALVVEVSLMPLYMNQTAFDGLVAELSRFGYEYAGNLDQVYAKNGAVAYIDALFIRHGVRR